MKAITSSFTVNFRRAVCNVAAIRAYASDVKRSDVKDSDHQRLNKQRSNEDPLNSIKPHMRGGILSVVEKDNSGFPSYLILKETSPLLSQAMMEIKNKKRRQQNSSILLEGKRLIQDALNAGVKPKQIFFSQKRVLENLCLPEELRDLPASSTIFYKAPYKMIQLFSETETSQGIMGIFEIPTIDHRAQKNAFPITVICDNIREPGNLGAVLRTVTAVGASQVILMKGCTNLWGDKVLRAGCGAHFRMKIISDVSWSFLENIKGQVCLADNNYVGNIDYSIINEDTNVNVFRKTAPIELPIAPYYEIDYCKTTPLILIIGGETHGLSDEGYEFARLRKGIRVNIPLENGIESLNSATAVGILCFEAKKQMLSLIRSGDEIDKIEQVY
ncbi:rRNA methyltransferase 3, mitochondrial [Metopolophium dirhodum]|uniref:rRNA methyltransferase 3, mitochondrial n=1 Tax=Metopolophium dirhodum TaxID=44670 RepID=UPI002990124C|nr:rRNA methyltransferase 3, mitochondrial [Metopolophium dirhodum]